MGSITIQDTALSVPILLEILNDLKLHLEGEIRLVREKEIY